MLEVKKLTGNIGAEISGVDLCEHLSPDTVAEIKQALLDHGVIFFRNQKILPDADHVRLGKYFGELDSSELPENKGVEQEVLFIDLVGNGKSGGADIFHRDRPYLEAPPMGSILQQVMAPEGGGGDTCWMSTYAAYDWLSEPMKALLDPLYAVHSIQPTLKHSPDVAKIIADKIPTWPSAIHPVVEVHPETGRKALNINAAWVDRILGLTPAESEALLQLLFNHVKDPIFQVRFNWNVGDVAFWDNRCCLHYAVPDYNARRVMKRVAFRGTKPVGPFGEANRPTA